MPRKLPKGWINTTLGELVEPSSVRVSPQAFPTLRYVGLEHIEPQTMRLLGHANARDARSTSIQFSKGDVLYGKMRPYLNKVWVAEFEGLCSAEFLVFPKLEGLNNEFLAFRLNAEDFVTFANNKVTGERPRVDFRKLSLFPILLPPSSEQDRIVSKLDIILSRLERGKTATNRAQDRLIRYRTIVVDAAIKGDLTGNWRASRSAGSTNAKYDDEVLLTDILARRSAYWEKAVLERVGLNHIHPDRSKRKYPEPKTPSTDRPFELPNGWAWIGWEQVGFAQNGRAFPSKEYSRVGVKLLRPGNLHADGSIHWNEKNTRHVPSRMEQANLNLVIRGNELVINLTAQSLKDDFLGRVCLTSRNEHCLLNQRLARLTPVFGIPKFFLYVFKSSIFRRFVDGLNSGSLIQHMFTSQLGQFALPLPPMSEQAEIIRETDRRLVAAARMAKALERQLVRSVTMRQTTLNEAFFGRLISQNSQDEHAALLLSRLNIARATKERKPRSTRMPKSPAQPTVRGRPISPEELFRTSGYSRNNAVDEFFAELRNLTKSPARIVEERTRTGRILLRIAR
jgi:type I restriction enzyme, S subunit